MESLQARLTTSALRLCDERTGAGIDATKLRADIEAGGAIAVIKSVLARSESGMLDILGYGRPDLSLEAFALRPAWRSLLSADEMSIAQARLQRAKLFLQPDQQLGNAIPFSQFRDVLWVNDMPVAAASGFDLRTAPDVCDQLHGSSLNLDEIGEVRHASVGERLHLRSCPNCLSECANLLPVFDALDLEQFSKLRKIIGVISDCIEIWKRTKSFTPSEATAWRVIVLSQYLEADIFSGEVSSWVAARNEEKSDALHTFISSLSPNEFTVLRLADHIFPMFEGAELAVSGKAVLLPSFDGDLKAVPGIFITQECRTWEGMIDLIGAPPNSTVEMPGVLFSCSELLRVLLSSITADERRQTHPHPPIPNEISKKSHSEIVKTDEEVETLLAPFNHRELREKGQSLLRTALGDYVYGSLCSEAKLAAMNAEVILDSVRLLDYSPFVTELAKAFELQLDRAIFQPFCDNLIEQGIRTFPEEFRPTPGKPGARAEKPMIKHGSCQKGLTLGQRYFHLQQPYPEWKPFFNGTNLDHLKLLGATKRILQYAGTAKHEGGFTYHLAKELRDDWLGAIKPANSVFSALIPQDDISGPM